MVKIKKSSLQNIPVALKEDFATLREKALSVLRGEDTFWALIEFIPDAVVVHTNNKIIYHNPAAAELFMTDSDDGLLGRNFIDFVHPNEHQGVLQRRRQVSSNVQVSGAATRQHLRRDGSIFYSQNTFLKFGPANEPVYLVILRDITSSLETERALELGEKQFQQFFDDASVGMMIVEENSTIRHANPALCNMHGFSPEELKGKSVKDFSHPEDIRIGSSEIQGAIKEKNDTVNFEKRYLSKENETVWVALNSSIIRDFAGNFSHMVCHIENITDRKLSEQALAKHQKGLTELHKIGMDQEISHQEKIESVLKLGCEMFDLPIAFVGKFDAQHYETEFAVGPGTVEFVGSAINSEDSPCYYTYTGNMPVGYHDVSSSPLAKAPSYKKMNFKAYLGTPLYIAKEKHGTICYLSYETRALPFDEYDISFLDLLAQWIGDELHRHKVELEKKLEFNRFKALTEYAGDAIFVRDNDGNILEVNQTACDRLGYTREEILQMKVWDISPGMDSELLNEDSKQISKSGFSVSRGNHKRKGNTPSN